MTRRIAATLQQRERESETRRIELMETTRRKKRGSSLEDLVSSSHKESKGRKKYIYICICIKRKGTRKVTRAKKRSHRERDARAHTHVNKISLSFHFLSARRIERAIRCSIRLSATILNRHRSGTFARRRCHGLDVAVVIVIVDVGKAIPADTHWTREIDRWN